MKLPEAIALMLGGKVMVDRFEICRSISVVNGECFFRWLVNMEGEHKWTRSHDDSLPLDGWREATPEELKEIGL